MVTHQLEAVVPPEHLITYEDRRNAEDAALNCCRGIGIEAILYLLGLGPGQGRICVEASIREKRTDDFGIRRIPGLGPAGAVHRIVKRMKTVLVFCHEGRAQGDARVALDELNCAGRNGCTTELGPMSHAGLVVGLLARAEFGSRNRRLGALGKFDQLTQLDGEKVDLDIQICEVLFDSATAEVGPRSGVVEVEGDLAHCNSFRFGLLESATRWLPRPSNPRSLRRPFPEAPT